jgi:hypothetical protein
LRRPLLWLSLVPLFRGFGVLLVWLPLCGRLLSVLLRRPLLWLSLVPLFRRFSVLLVWLPLCVGRSNRSEKQKERSHTDEFNGFHEFASSTFDAHRRPSIGRRRHSTPSCRPSVADRGVDPTGRVTESNIDRSA